MLCEICGSEKQEIFYAGEIRNGTVGNYVTGAIGQCVGCGVQRLPDSLRIPELCYQRDEYRKHVGETKQEYFLKHDKEQPARLQILYDLGFQLRGKRIVDVGCGYGSFVDHVQHISKANGIDPGCDWAYYSIQEYREHNVPCDLATSFLVIEHVKNPKDFLKEINSILQPDGRFLISTPDRNYAYNGFKNFYRTQHNWYFNKDSLKTCIELSGLKVIDFRWEQDYYLYAWCRRA